MKIKGALFALSIFVFLSVPVFAHSGKTDDNGGHYSDTGYHYHHGYPAHQHENGYCPYNFDDQTQHKPQHSSDETIYPKVTESPKDTSPSTLSLLVAVIVCSFLFGTPLFATYTLITEVIVRWLLQRCGFNQKLGMSQSTEPRSLEIHLIIGFLISCFFFAKVWICS